MASLSLPVMTMRWRDIGLDPPRAQTQSQARQEHRASLIGTTQQSTISAVGLCATQSQRARSATRASNPCAYLAPTKDPQEQRLTVCRSSRLLLGRNTLSSLGR